MGGRYVPFTGSAGYAYSNTDNVVIGLIAKR
jgi:hypothetical protein